MAPTAVAHLLFFLFVLFNNAAPQETTTSSDYNTTASGDFNATANLTDGYTVTPEATEPTLSSGGPEETVRPTVASLPLPESGQLPSPVTDVGRLCPCDDHSSACDLNCCCDPDCGEEVALFTGCSVQTVGGNKQLCSSAAASYSLRSTVDGFAEVQASVGKEANLDAFCIRSQNRFDGFSHPSPTIPTDANFDSLFQRFAAFAFGSEGDGGGREDTEPLPESRGYKYGDPMVTAGPGGQRGTLLLPSPGLTGDCVDTNPAAFLKDQTGSCSRRLNLRRDCGTLAALDADTYTNVRIFAEKKSDAAAAVFPVVLVSVLVQSVSGTQTEAEFSDGETPSPVLLTSDLCANVVLKVAYVIQFGSEGEILNASASVVLGFIPESSLPLKQDFHISFVQAVEEVSIQLSGNPGYVVGLPLVSGSRTSKGMVRSSDVTQTLSLLETSGDQDCLRGPHRRSPVRFAVDSVSGCVLRLEDVSNCSLVSQQLLDTLRGPDYPQYVASFGNSPLQNPLDWVQIKRSFSPGEAQSCSVPLSLHLEVQWTQYGSLRNPQPQVVSVVEVVQSNSSSLTRDVFVRTSVSFKAASAAARPGFRATPTINAKLPFNFFFPFV